MHQMKSLVECRVTQGLARCEDAKERRQGVGGGSIWPCLAEYCREIRGRDGWQVERMIQQTFSLLFFTMDHIGNTVATRHSMINYKNVGP